MDKRPESMPTENTAHDHAVNEASPSRKGKKAWFNVFEGIKVRIGWKITAIVVLVMAVLAVINIMFVRGKFSSVMNREFESKARAIALTIVNTNTENIANREFTNVQEVMDGYKDVEGVNYIYVEDAEGFIGAGVFNKGFSEKLKGLNPVTGEEDYKIARFVIEDVGDILDVAVPVLFGKVGTVHVGMDHGLIVNELGQITSNLITQFAVASILGVILLHLIIIFLLRHIKTILKTLTRVGSGDLTARVNVPTRDEFRDLAVNLNNTLVQLGSIVEKVEQSYEGISQANNNIVQVYHDVQEGIDQQAGLASETMESVTSNKRMIDEVTGGIHVLENSSNDSFSSVMEMGASIEEVSSMSDSLFNSVKESNDAIEELLRSIEQISDNLVNLSSATEDTAGAMNEMSASIVEVRSNAESTAQDAVKMTQVAEEGAEISRKAREGMNAIKESSTQVNQTISLVSERIEEIDEILRFITDITGKTNLLALNAAIIAAQAGAQGKGFGVVADEINELAQSTKAQTNRIADVIEGLREEVQRTSDAVKESNKKVDEGSQLTEEVTRSLEGIMDNTMLVSHRIEEIAQTTSEQASTSSRVLETTQHLTESVGNIKTLSQQQTEAGTKLVRMSHQVRQVAEKVKTSTEEQTKTSQQINEDLTKISDTVRNISESTEIQVVNGGKVLKLTEDLTGVINRNRQTVHGLQDVIDELNKRLVVLHQDLKIFITSSEGKA